MSSANGLRIGRGRVGHWSPPGRQSRLRSRRQPLRTYSGSRGQAAPVSIFRVTAPARASPTCPGSSTPPRLRLARRTALRLEPFRGAGVSRERGRYARAYRHRPRVAVGSRSTPTGSCTSGTVGDDLPRRQRYDRAVRDAARQRHRLSSGHRSGGDLFVSAPTLASYDHVYASTRRRRTLAAHALRPPAGIAFSARGPTWRCPGGWQRTVPLPIWMGSRSSLPRAPDLSAWPSAPPVRSP